MFPVLYPKRDAETGQPENAAPTRHADHWDLVESASANKIYARKDSNKKSEQ